MARSHGRGRRRGGGAHEESGERWLLTYADMITLLLALFIVLFSISSVNISKVQSLQDPCAPGPLRRHPPRGKATAKPGSTANASHAPPPLLCRRSPISPQSMTSPEGCHPLELRVELPQRHAEHEHQRRARAEQLRTPGARARLLCCATRIRPARHHDDEGRGLAIRVLTDSLLLRQRHPRPAGRTVAARDRQPERRRSSPDRRRRQTPTTYRCTAASSQAIGSYPRRARARSYCFPISGACRPALERRRLRLAAPDRQQRDSSEGRALNRRVEIVLQRIY